MAGEKIRWFFIDDAGNLRGPADVETLAILVNGGVVTPATQMRREDLDEWAAAETFFDFETEETPPPPPPPPAPTPPPLPATPPPPSSKEWTPPTIPKEAWKMLGVEPPTPSPSGVYYPNVIDKSPQLSYIDRIGMPVAEMRGIQGEEEMLRILERRLPLGGDRGYRIVRNLMFETPTGTTQLDFAIVSAFGIFIVEVKNFSGWIFGDPNDKRWTQSLKGGRKFPFQNPIHQNFKHLAVLAEKTGIPQNLIFPLVAFADDCDFKTEMPANVMHFADVADYIRRFKMIVIKPEQLSEIMEAFLSWDNAIDREKKREHVQNLKDAHAPASIHDRNVLCPVCGNRMILRTSRKDGNRFWGCSKYPGCRGIREAVE